MQKKTSLLKLFTEIRLQTGYTVIWNETEVNVNRNLDANFKNMDINAVFHYVTSKLPLSYSITGKMIVLKNKLPGKTPEVDRQPEPIDGSPKFGGLKEQNEYHLHQVDIVSTGYQYIAKERATGSFVLVDSSLLSRKVGPDIFSRLEGITNGLLFNKNTLRSTSGGLDLSIRGRSTIYANDQPLIVLDNFPFNGDFNSINPNDVANVTVLKDAAAASIWGVKAGNGVIVVTTKRGKYRQPLNFSFNSNLTVSGKPDVFYNQNYLSSTDFIDIETYLFGQGKYDQVLTDKVNYPFVSPAVKILEAERNGQSAAETERQLDALRGNDIRKEELQYFYRKPILQQYFLNASGGSAKTSHYFSMGYDRELSTLINNEHNRVTLNTQHSLKLLKNLELNVGLNYIGTIDKIDSTVIRTSVSNFTPYYQFKDSNGIPTVFEGGYNKEFNGVMMSRGFLDWSYVPLDELNMPPSTFNGNDLRLNTSLKYVFFSGLSGELKYQYQQINNTSELICGLDSYLTRSAINRYAIVSAGQVKGYNIPLGAIQYQTIAKAAAKNLRGQLNYDKEWGKHTVSAIGGYEFSEFDTQVNKYTRYAYGANTGNLASVDTISTFNLNPSGSGKISTGTDLFGRLERVRSVFANAAYSYDDRYTISASARMDGSNYFGVKTNQKNVPLWSVGGLWNIDKENFYKAEWLPSLKLRMSYGFNGNLDRGNTGITTFRVNALNALYTNLPYSGIMNFGNPELRWERIGIANFGLDFGLKNQVLTGRVEYFFKRGLDMLGDKAFPSSAGIKTLRGNYAEMKASGWDLILNAQHSIGLVKWQSSLLFSAVHDELTLYDVIEPNSARYVTGNYLIPVRDKPVYGLYSYSWAGLDPLTGDPRGYLNNEVSKDYNAILKETKPENLEYNGPARPTVFGAWNNSISFHKFTFSVNLSYKLGYYFRKPSVNYYEMYHMPLGASMNNDYVKRWQEVGDENKTTIPSMGKYTESDARDRFYNGSSATVIKGDHIRLQDMSLSFNLDVSNWRTIPVKQIQLYTFAQNLGLLWRANKVDLDPDFVAGDGDRLANPLPKSFSFGLKANF